MEGGWVVRALSLKDKGGSVMVLALGGTGPTNYLSLPQLGVGGLGDSLLLLLVPAAHT